MSAIFHVCLDKLDPVAIGVSNKCDTAHFTFLGFLLEGNTLLFEPLASSFQVRGQEPSVSKSLKHAFLLVLVIAVVILKVGLIFSSVVMG